MICVRQAEKIRLICLLIFAFALIVLTACKPNDDNKNADFSDAAIHSHFSEDDQTDGNAKEIEDSQRLIKTLDEKHDRYNFAYGRSALSIKKEIFDEYALTDENVQKFFDIAEIMYDKLADLFPDDPNVTFDPPRPEVFAYHSVPKEWGSEPDLYDDYSDVASRTDAWSNCWTNETFYAGERGFALWLRDIDIAFPAVIGHEVGHLFTALPQYVWDLELLSYFAMFYIASEIPMIDATGTTITNDYWKTWENLPEWTKFFGLAEKYGYGIISDTFKEMLALSSADIDLYLKLSNDMAARFELFRQILSQKTGDDIDYYFDR